jgi:hypothetical protein
LIVESIQSKLVREEPPRQPLKCSIPVSRSTFESLFGVQYALLLDDNDIFQLLGEGYKKTFTQGSYVTVKAPVVIQYNTDKNRMQIEFYCECRNDEHRIQWPHEEFPTLEEAKTKLAKKQESKTKREFKKLRRENQDQNQVLQEL